LGTAARASSVATMTTGSVKRASVNEEQRIDDLASQPIAEEPQAENAEHDARHARQVVDRDPHGTDDRASLGVLPQIERGQDAERNHGQRHEHGHRHGAENRVASRGSSVRNSHHREA
jgi:hypothetical protein